MNEPVDAQAKHNSNTVLRRTVSSTFNGHAWLTSLMLVLFALLSGSSYSRAQSPASPFEAANQLYDAGNYTNAAAAYEKLVQSGQNSAAIYFNLGNAYFKAGQLGHAIAAYRRAGLISPRDPDIRANLQFARNQVQGPTLPIARWQRFLGELTLNEWTILSCAGVWLCLLLLVLLQWRPTLKPVLRNYIVAIGIAAGLTCACLGAAFTTQRSARIAIVTARDAAAHNGPLDESPNAFIAHDGAELRLMDQKDEWLQVSTGNRIGWLRRDKVVL